MKIASPSKNKITKYMNRKLENEEIQVNKEMHN